MKSLMIVDLPRSLIKRKLKIYWFERSIVSKGFEIVYRKISNGQLLIVYEDKLNKRETID
ncbi:hypothetical protein GCM10025886_14110 [Tetragenococcus halophilus subsp. flandriensis]|uniref:hypothetical protein n=1 Tax=Tetragenococcus halophilus TaxID=51669 RepID=UPI0023E92A3A|nr:hypothetical protein [Tetragenococcus halophilus]GMA08260.1 hypothetical protein GCM10025886_14110 [Tetragenococcus halophilus subsp. flandriensis]